jgi:peptidyl-dipeptidase A
MVRRPKGRDLPDYAAKIHVVSAPAYYHNYMMGQLFACQVHESIAKNILKSKDVPNAIYTDNKSVGRYMIEKVFTPGATLSWNELTKHATGADLNAKAFAAEFAAE